MKEQEYTIKMKKGYTEMIVGKPFPVVDWMKTFIRFDEDIKRYVLCEETSGTFVSIGNTMKEAKANALRIINVVGMARTLKLIEEMKNY